jgi:hypothetical protein
MRRGGHLLLVFICRWPTSLRQRSTSDSRARMRALPRLTSAVRSADALWASAFSFLSPSTMLRRRLI